MSIIDLLLAEAIAAGMVRHALREAQPPPDNFYEIPPNEDAWDKICETCKEENMVICIEITDDSHPPSKRVQPLFMDLAREIPKIPFFRARISENFTHAKMREELGNLKCSPTIVAVLFTDEGRMIRGVEGEDSIRRALRTNAFHQVIKDLIDKRIKLKIAEKMAERFAGVMVASMLMKRRQASMEYEEKLKEEKKELESKEGNDKDLSELSKSLKDILDLSSRRK